MAPQVAQQAGALAEQFLVLLMIIQVTERWLNMKTQIFLTIMITFIFLTPVITQGQVGDLFEPSDWKKGDTVKVVVNGLRQREGAGEGEGFWIF